MTAKVTLITPPDIYQNDQESVLFIDLTELEQDLVSEWLGKANLNINIYFYQGEPNVPWLLHALACSHYKYINLNKPSPTVGHLAGYLLGKAGVCYNVNDTDVAELYSHINLNRVDDVITFLERAFDAKE
jgi:hypothetical protein